MKHLVIAAACAAALVTAAPALALDSTETAAAQASADSLRDFCPSRPGLGTPPCIVDAGHLQIELGLGDWTRDNGADSVTHSFATGDLFVRYGLDSMTELQLGVTAFSSSRQRDRTTGVVQRSRGIGDVTLGLRRSLVHPDGSGTSIALQPYVTLDTGDEGVGAGDWGAGLLVPMSFSLGQLSLGVTPEVDAAVDQDGHGRHASYGSVVGLGGSIAHGVSATVELSAFRDEDPAGHSTQLLAGLSAAWQPGHDWQLDVGANAGLNDQTPDLEVYFGIAKRF